MPRGERLACIFEVAALVSRGLHAALGEMGGQPQVPSGIYLLNVSTVLILYGRIALPRGCIRVTVYQLNETVKTAFLKTPLEPSLLAGFWGFCAQNDLSPSVALRRVVSHVLAQAGYEIEDYDPAKERTNDYTQWARRRRERIEMDGAHPVLIARVPPGMRSAFERYSAARDSTASQELHALVRHVVRSAKIEAGELEPPKAPALRSARVTVRLSELEMRGAEELATDFGGVREWIVALVRAKVYADQPQLSLNEVATLYESNRELWAIGRNINQIAHAINLDMQQAGRLQGSAVRLRELETLKASIDAHTAKVVAMCNASFERWRDE